MIRIRKSLFIKETKIDYGERREMGCPLMIIDALNAIKSFLSFSV
jgi:hypothetical protein